MKHHKKPRLYRDQDPAAMAAAAALLAVALAAAAAAEFVEIDTEFGRIRGVKKLDPPVTVGCRRVLSFSLLSS